VFPFLLGVMLFGHAFQKYGLARRMATTILSIRGVATSGNRLVLMLLVVSALISAFVDDAATVAIMMPIALSVARFAGTAHTTNESTTLVKTPRMVAACSLAVLYGASAGGLATPAGVPFNPLAISLLEQLTAYRISFAQWATTGVLLMAATIPIYYGVVRFMLPVEVKSISGGSARFTAERKAMGPLSQGEKNVLFVFAVMIVLWLLPSFVTVAVLDIWYVPPVAIVLLYLLPVDARMGQMTLSANDFQDGVLWNVLFMVVSGTAMASALGRLGVSEWLGRIVSGGVPSSVLPWLAGIMTPLVSHATSGTATTSIVSTMLFPIAENLNYNPAILARIIAGTALAVSFPWAGAAAGTAFAAGAIEFGTMFRVGIIATICTSIAITILSMILVPALAAFSHG
jgi:solute carrier family 13 (sodium-dependent dicarboxylate transporter), member 2/3/5